MNRTQKQTEIDAVRERFNKSVASVLVDFQGMNVEAVNRLRREFQHAGVEYRVVKNTLIRHAVKDSPLAALAGDLVNHTKAGVPTSVRGMTGVAWCNADPAAAAKCIVKVKKDLGAVAGEKLKVKAGLLGGQIRDGQWVVSEMAKLPGLQEVRAMLLATIQAPAQNLVAIINAPAQNLAYLLDALRRKMEEAQGSADQTPPATT
ncbi:MAG: 50S ribosomal protein L10 [Deltaproteobacteria bacterium]|nr:50S ribosomal protein L10 [Deltaproteobacteria bacterium]